MRGGFGGRFQGPGRLGQAPPGGNVTGQVSGPIPPQYGGNAVQGKGIYFTYAHTPVGSLAAGNTTSGAQSIQFDANSVFIWLRSTFTAGLAGTAGPPFTSHAFTQSSLPIPQIAVNIQDTGKGASFMNTPIPVYQIASVVPGLPYILPTPQLIQANSSFTWTYTNYEDTNTWYGLQFQLHGIRVFDPTITTLAQVFG